MLAHGARLICWGPIDLHHHFVVRDQEETPIQILGYNVIMFPVCNYSVGFHKELDTNSIGF